MISDTVPLWSIIVFIAIIAVTAYITAIERALSSVNKTRIREMEEEGSTKAARLIKIIDDPGSYMPAFRAIVVVLSVCASVTAFCFFTTPIRSGLSFLGMQEGDVFDVVSIVILILLLALVADAEQEPALPELPLPYTCTAEDGQTAIRVQIGGAAS